MQVPANRIGAARFSLVQLKVMQEIITLVVFAVFITLYFGQHLRWNHAAAGVCLVCGGVLCLSHLVAHCGAARALVARSAGIALSVTHARDANVSSGFEKLLRFERGHAA